MFYQAGFLSKIAEISPDLKAEIASGLIGGGAGLGLSYGARKALDYTSKSNLLPIEDLASSLATHNPSKVPFMESSGMDLIDTMLGGESGAAYFDEIPGTGKGGIFLGKKRRTLPIAAHELGHATGRRGLIKFVNPTSMLGSLAGGLLASTGDPEDRTRTHTAAAISGLSQLPMLAEEGRAWKRGRSFLKDIGKTKGLYKTMIPAAGSYAGMTGLAVATPYLLSHLRRKFKEEEEENKSFMSKLKNLF